MDSEINKILFDYKDHLVKQGASPATVERKLSSARAYLKLAQESGSTEIFSKELADSGLSQKEIEQKLSNLGITVSKNSFFSQLLIVRLLKKLISLPSAIAKWRYTVPYSLKYSQPNWLVKYRKSSFGRALNFAFLLIICATLAIFGYQKFGPSKPLEKSQVATITTTPPATTTSLETTPSFLSFNAKLSDINGEPITKPTAVRFSLYDDKTASGSAKVYEEAKTITPDEEGNFETIIGDTTPLDKAVFKDNYDLYLGITIDQNEEMADRQHIPTVGYAADSQKVGGYGVGEEGIAGVNQIPVVNAEGEMVIAAQGPVIRSTSGTFQIEGQTLLLKATGNGNVNLSGNTATGNAINITGPSLTTGTLLYGAVQNDNSGYKLVHLQTGKTLADKFIVYSNGDTFVAGNIGIGTYHANQKLDVNGGINVGGTAYLNTVKISGALADSTGSFGSTGKVLSSTGTGTSWTEVSTSSSGMAGSGTINYLPKFTAATTLGNSKIFDNGTNVGIGTSLPTSTLDVVGNAYFSNIVNVGVGLTTATLTLTTGANNGYYLKSDASGNASWASIPSGTVYTASNGITETASDFQLGGTLSKITAINQNGFHFGFQGTGNVGVGTTDPGQKLDIIGGSIRTDNQFISTLAIGTSPLAVTSTTVVTNLNVDMLDGYHYNNLPYLTDNQTITLTGDVTGVGGTAITTAIASGVIVNDDINASAAIDWSKINKTGSNITDIETRAHSSLTGLDYASAGHTGFQATLTNPVTGTGTTSVLPKFSGSTTIADSRFFDNGTNIGIGNTNPLAFIQLGNIEGGTAAMSILANGNVGIGTTAPAHRLDVSGDIGIASGSDLYLGTIKLSDTGANNTSSGAYKIGVFGEFAYSGSTNVQDVLDDLDAAIGSLSGGAVTGSGTDKYLARWNGTTALQSSSVYVKDDGTVGIGTTNPTQQLQTTGNALIGGTAYFGSTSYFINPSGQATLNTSSTINGLSINAGTITAGTWNGNAVTVQYGGTGLTSAAQGDLLYGSAANTLAALTKSTTANSFLKNSGADNNPAWSTIASSDLSDGANIAHINVAESITGGWNFGTANTYWNLGSAANGVWDTTGNVGIGTTIPAYKLEVNGTLGVGATAYFAGNVGIGTTNPTSQLYVIGNTYVSSIVNIGVGATTPTITITTGASSGYYLKSDASGNGTWAALPAATVYTASNGLTLVTNDFQLGGTLSKTTAINLNNFHFGFQGTGNVGVGTTDPAGLFQVKAGAASALIVASGGNVGIGTVDTYGKLSVTSASGPAIYSESTSGNYGIQAISYGGSSAIGGHISSLSDGTASTGLTTSAGAVESSSIATQKSLNVENVLNTGASVTDLYGIYVNDPTNSGTITNNFGVYIAAQTAGSSENFSLYSNGGKSYFAGNVGIGTTNPDSIFTVMGGTGGSTNLFSLYSKVAGSVATSVETHRLYYDTDGDAIIDLYNKSGTNAVRLATNGNSYIDGGQLSLNTGPIIIGSTAVSGTNPAMSLERTITGASNAHGIQDYSNVNLNATYAYAAYDVRNIMSGTASMDHFVGFQFSPTYNNSGTITQILGATNLLTVQQGTITNFIQYKANNPTVTGGSIVNQYGFYVDETLDAATNNWAFYSTGTTKSYFGGNVGIGTTDPLQKLQVAGDINIESGSGIRINNTATSGNYLRGDGTRFVSSALQSGDVSGFISGTANVISKFTGANSLGNSRFFDNGTNIGIGNTNPLAFVQIGNIGGGTAAMTILATGKVGIGTTNPVVSLDVYKNLRLGVESGAINYILSRDDSGGADYRELVVAANSINFKTATASEGDTTQSALYLQNTSGNVGIGTTNPLGLLQVGSLGGGTAPMLVMATGNVGIGTTAPASSLEILGVAPANKGQLVLSTPTDDASAGILFNENGITNSAFIHHEGAHNTGYLEIEDYSSGWATTGLVIKQGNVGIGTTSPLGLLQVGNLGGGTAAMSILSNGNVGIGTTNPGAKLEVADYTRITGSATAPTTGEGLEFLYGSSTGYMQAMGRTGGATYKDLVIRGLNVQMQGNGSLGMYIQNGGNVGIGTTNPGRKLDVFSDFATTNTIEQVMRISRTTSGTAANGIGADMILMAEDDAGAAREAGSIRGVLTSVANASPVGYLGLSGRGANYGSEHLVILQSGNVGIGTTNPTDNLAVYGTSAAAGNISYRITNTTATGYVQNAVVAGSNTLYYYNFGQSYTTSGRFVQSSGLVDSNGAGGLGLAASNAAGVIRFYTNVSNERMRIASDGNVGIGITAPTALTHISSTAAQDLFRVDDNGYGDTSPFVIDAVGNAGIGTTSPTQKLDVAGNVNIGGSMNMNNYTILNVGNAGTDFDTSGGLTLAGDLRLNNNQILNSAGTAAIIFSSTPTTAWSTLNAGAWKVSNTANLGLAALVVDQLLDGDIFAASASGVPKFVITNSGNVGIGTTVPVGPLMVGIGATHAFIVNSVGNVGIGTTAPTQKFEIYGGNQLIWNDSTLGGELLSNTTFDSDTTSWTASSGTLASVAGGQSNNALEVTNSGTAYGYAYQAISTIAGTRYKLTFYHKNGTIRGLIRIGTSTGGNQLYSNDSLNDADWTSRTIYFTATTSTTYIRLGNGLNTASETTLFDEISVKEVMGGNLALSGVITGYAGTSGIKVTGAGNVGIGTTTPSSLLTLMSTAGSQGYQKIITIGQSDAETFGGSIGKRVATANTRAGLKVSSATNLTLHSGVTTASYPAFQLQIGTVADETVDTNTVLTVLGNGNVGIGTTNPTNLLQLSGTGQEMLRLTHTGSNEGYMSFFNGTTARGYLGAADAGTLFTGAGPDSISLRAQNALHLGGSGDNLTMTLVNGNVGIGTTNPVATLHLGAAGAQLLIGKATSTGVSRTIETAYAAGANTLQIWTYSATTTDASTLQLTKSATNTLNTLTTTVDGDVLGQVIADGINASPTRVNAALIKFIQSGAAGASFVPADMTFSLSTAAAANAERMRITSAGNVGIGTTGPEAKLHISGGGLKLTNTGSDPTIQFQGSTDSYFMKWNIASNYLDFQNSSTQSQMVLRGGKVGIGTTSPAGTLDVVKNSNAVNGLYVQNSTADTAARELVLVGEDTTTKWGSIQHLNTSYTTNGLLIPNSVFVNSADTGGLSLIAQNAAGVIRFATAGYAQANERMRIDSTGNVGIGTTDPDVKLDIQDANPVYLKLFNTTTYAASTPFNTGGVLFKSKNSSGTEFNSAQILVNTPSSSSRVSYMRFQTGYADVLSDIMTLTAISGGGNVGIGTTIPAYKLEVNGTLGVGATAYFAGNVGIGTTNPLANLDIKSAAGFTRALKIGPQTTTVGDGAYIEFTSSSTDAYGAQIGGIREAASGYNALVFKTGANAQADRMRITNDGNIGVGTTVPTSGYKMEIAGNTYISGGNLGVGTTATYRLQLPNVANATGQGQANAWQTYSSGRWKENVVTIQNALEKIDQLNPVYFDWKQEYGGNHSLGFIAEEIGKIIPEAVTWEEDGIYAKGMDYDKLSVIAIKGIQEQQIQINALTDKLNTLDSTGELVSTQTQTTATYSGVLGENLQAEKEKILATKNNFSIINSAGGIANSIVSKASGLFANIKTGVVETSGLIAENIVGNRIISPEIKVDYISPLAEDVTIDLEKKISADSQADASGSKFGKLLVKGDAEFTGNVGVGATFQAENISANQLEIRENLIAKDASISGELVAESARIRHLKAESIEGMEALIASMSGQPTEYADLTNIQDQIASLSSQLAESTSTLSGMLAEASQSWSLVDPKNDVKIAANVQILGITSLAQTIIAGPVTQDGTLIIDEGNAINVLGGTLYLQNKGMGGIDLLAGKVTIDQLGNAVFEGNLTVKGAMFANLIKPVDGGDITFDLSQTATDSAEPKFGQLIVNGEVAANGFKVAGQVLAAEANAEGVYEFTTSAGTAKLAAGVKEVSIKTPFVKENSLTYLTPIGSTKNQVIYLSRILTEENIFVVGIDTVQTKDLEFNWWIVN